MYNVGKPTDKVTKISVIEFKKYQIWFYLKKKISQKK